MNNWQETLLFPVADAEARKQFLIAGLVALAGFIIPILPTFLLMLPLFILLGAGMYLMMTGSMGFSLLADARTSSFAPVAAIFLVMGVGLMTLFGVLSLPYGIMVSPAVPHAVASNSFSAGLMLVSNTIYAQAYNSGRDALQLEAHASS